MLCNPRCSFSLLECVFFDTNGLRVKFCQIIEQFLLIPLWDVECTQLFKKRFSQFVNIFWVNMLNTITTSNQISFQIPRLWEKCVTRSTAEGFEQCVDVVDVAKVIVVSWRCDALLNFWVLLRHSSPISFPSTKSTS